MAERSSTEFFPNSVDLRVVALCQLCPGLMKSANLWQSSTGMYPLQTFTPPMSAEHGTVAQVHMLFFEARRAEPWQSGTGVCPTYVKLPVPPSECC